MYVLDLYLLIIDRGFRGGEGDPLEEEEGYNLILITLLSLQKAIPLEGEGY